MFTTAQVSILVPFATQELDDAGGNFYGQNKHSRNLVVCNRKKLTSPMGFVCGKTGSAETSDDKSVPTNAWFVGFIRDESKPYAVAVVVEQGGAGSTVATPIGRQALEKAIEVVG